MKPGILAAVSIWYGYAKTRVFRVYHNWAIIQDTVQGENVGGASGFVHFTANCAGMIGPLVTGWIVHSTGAFTGAFLLAGGVAIIAAILVAMFVKPIASIPT